MTKGSALRRAASTAVILACSAIGQGQSSAAETSGFTPMVIEQVSLTRQLGMLHAICEDGSIGVEGDTAGCETCPSYTGASGETDRFEISNVIEGNFTQSDVAEAAVDMQGCESHSGLYGGTVILQRTSKGWQRLLYEPGFRSDQCITFRTSDRVQAMACNIVDSAQGIQLGSFKWIELRNATFKETTLFRWFDNVQSNPARLVSVFPYRFVKSDFNQDARVDLRVMFRMRDEQVPGKYAGAIDAIDAGYRFADPETLRLTYLFDGKALSLERGSSEAKERIDAMLNKHLPESE